MLHQKGHNWTAYVFSYQTVYMHISGSVVSPGQAYTYLLECAPCLVCIHSLNVLKDSHCTSWPGQCHVCLGPRYLYPLSYSLDPCPYHFNDLACHLSQGVACNQRYHLSAVDLAPAGSPWVVCVPYCKPGLGLPQSH
jgi:hypothetical protein